MRIIGGRDYYDNALAYGIDPTIVFVREHRHPRIVTELEFPYVVARIANCINEVNNVKLYSSHLYCVNIIVCGKLYYGVKVYKYNRSDSSYENEQVFWNFEQLDKWVQDNKFTYYKTKFHDGKKELKKYFNRLKEFPELTQWLISNRITIATYDCENVQRNDYNVWVIDSDNLKDYQFYKAIDPVTIFQEISMWIGGVLSNNNDRMVKITDDKIKIHKHGFDKWSFRRQGKNSVT